MTTIHFICRGNANRSVMAEAYLRSLKLPGITALSSGTIADIHQENELRRARITAVLVGHGVMQYAKTNPEQLTQDRAGRGTITICMNRLVANECKKIGTLPKNTQIWDIDDFGEGHRTAEPGEDRYRFAEEIYLQITDLKTNIKQ